jgi:hypothetical protein
MGGLAVSLGLGQAGICLDDLPVLAVVPVSGGVVEITAGPGTVQVTVSGGTPWDGTYSFDPATLSGGPVCLLAPAITGTGAIGQTLSASRAGLWVYEPAWGTPSVTGQWQADTAGNASYAALSGATGSSYVLTAAEGGDHVRRLETADQGSGRVRSAGSNGIAVAPSSILDTSVAPAATSQGTLSTVTGGRRWTQSATFAGYVSWAVTLTTGTSYRWQGNLTLSSGLDSLRMKVGPTSDLNTSPYQIDVNGISEGYVAGSNNFDKTFAVTGATGTYYIGMRIDMSAGVGATADLLNWTLQQV